MGDLKMNNDTCISLKSHAQFDVCITTTEMHTGGGAIRIIESGFPVPKGKTVQDKMDFLKKYYDGFRKLVMSEPRGHNDQYGILRVPPDHPDADIAIIFMHNRNYSTMCGHGVISAARYAVDRGLTRKPLTSPETAITIQCPCGLVTAYVEVDQENYYRAGRVRFQSVPSFVFQTDVELELPGVGRFQVDVAFGGAYFAFVTASDVGVTFGTTPIKVIGLLGNKIRDAAVAAVPVHHPHTKAFICGVMFVDSRHSNGRKATQLCTFSDAETDRSPCGSGTSARVALMYHRGLLALGEEHVFTSGATGQSFTASAVREAEERVAGHQAVITEVAGHGFYTGTSSFALEKGDVIGRGFNVV